MSIESQVDLDGFTRRGGSSGLAIDAMRSVRPGTSTKDLDEVGARVFRQLGPDELSNSSTVSRRQPHQP
jgi:hypothetical protein